jgi:hypothetical protein
MHNVTHVDDAPPISVLSISDGRAVNVHTITTDKSPKAKHVPSRLKSAAAAMGTITHILLTTACATVILWPL